MGTRFEENASCVFVAFGAEDVFHLELYHLIVVLEILDLFVLRFENLLVLAQLFFLDLTNRLYVLMTFVAVQLHAVNRGAVAFEQAFIETALKSVFVEQIFESRRIIGVEGERLIGT